MNHHQWVDEIRTLGGLADGDDEARLAIAGAKNFCYDYLRASNIEINSFIESGIIYIAAFMVSCATHVDSDIWQLYKSNDDYRSIFKNEASKNTGVLASLLNDAARIAPRKLQGFIVGAGMQLRVAPSGRGKGVGKVG